MHALQVSAPRWALSLANNPAGASRGMEPVLSEFR